MKHILIESDKKIEFDLPENWDELTTKQLLFLYQLLNMNVTVEELKLKMVLFCAKGRVRRYFADGMFRVSFGKTKIDLFPSEIYMIGRVFDYLFDSENQIQPAITRNPFPKLRIGLSTIYGPDDGLVNLKYSQYADLQVAHSLSVNKDGIDKFLSILYRKKNGKHAKMIRHISEAKKTIIVWFYLGCLLRFQELFPRVFAGDDSENSNPADGQMRIIDALAKNDLTKKEAVRNSDLLEALYTMEIAAEQYEELTNK